MAFLHGAVNNLAVEGQQCLQIQVIKYNFPSIESLGDSLELGDDVPGPFQVNACPCDGIINVYTQEASDGGGSGLHRVYWKPKFMHVWTIMSTLSWHYWEWAGLVVK